jgi:hypothetical protein
VDWWAYGSHAYGDRARAVVEGQLPWAFQTCMDAGWVARKIPGTSRQREVSWSNHKEVAALPPAEQAELLDQAKAENLTREKLRARVVERRRQRRVDDITAIRDRRLYRRDFATFDDYCRERWGMKRAHAYRLIDAAGVAFSMSPIGDIENALPANEGQARELSGLAPEQAAAVMVTPKTGYLSDRPRYIPELVTLATDTTRAPRMVAAVTGPSPAAA